MKYTRIYFLFGILFFVLFVFSVFSVPSKCAPITIRVGVYENAPKVFSDGSGGWAGFWPDIVEYIADKEDWTLDYVEGTWTECLTHLENEEIDLMIDVAYSEERALLYQFNNVSVFSNWGILYAAEPGIILSFNDLENKTVGVMNNSIHTTGRFGIMNLTAAFEINCTFIVVQDYYQVFQMLENGTVEVGVVNRLFGLLNQADYNVVQTTLIFNPVDLKFAFPQNAALNDYLIERIDYHLLSLQSDPDSIYYQSIEEHFMHIPEIESIPDWIIYLIIIVATVGSASIVMSFYLKREVNRKTKELRDTHKELAIVNQILLDTIPSGVLFVYQDGQMSIINQQFKTFYHDEYEVEISPSDNIYNLPDNELITPIKRELSSTRKPISSSEFTVRKETISLPSSSIHLNLFSTKILLEGTAPRVGHLFVIYDITPFIELEKAREQFVSMVSHELRTPLTAIDLSLNNLVYHHEDLNQQEVGKLLAIMKKSVDSLSIMIEDLLLTSQIESGSLVLTKKQLSLSEVLEGVLSELNPQISAKKLRVLRDLPPVTIHADLKRIAQVFRIILDNAVKFSPKSSEITIQAIDNYIGPQNPDEIPGILLKVIDHGVGIPKKDLPKLFQRFHRGANIIEVPGSGLGLNIAQTFVKLHNGTISIESQEGQGTTVSIFLPKTQ